MATEITDIDVDALSHILYLLAKSLDGARDFARSMAVCTQFLEAGNSHAILKSVCFQQVEVVNRYKLFLQKDGLLFRCASVGNIFAQFLLAQVILKSCTWLKCAGIKSVNLKKFRDYKLRCNRNSDLTIFQEDYLIASLVASVSPERGLARPFACHWELVKLFLSNCNVFEVFNLYRDIHNYIEYFTGSHICNGTDADVLLRFLCSMYVPYSKYMMMLSRGVDYNSILCEILASQHLLENANVEVKGMRVKALDAFDCVSSRFLGFVVPEK